MHRQLRNALTAALAACLASPAAAQQLPPNGSWRTVESAHFRVTYQAGLDDLARHAADRAEVAHQRLSESLTRPPSGKIDIVVSDNVDFTNGYATPFPSNRIVIYARPPVDVQGLDYYRDWIDLVVTHELTHIFHLDRAGRLGMGLRSAFGRLPLLWPMFPAVGTPRWSVEGLATHVESDFTGAGRVHGSYHDMVVRTAVLENRFDPLDRATASSPIWPGDERVYIYGSLFLDYLAERYGEEVRGKLVDKTASAAIPPVLYFGGVGRRTLGTSFGAAYSAWRDELRAQYGRLADSLRAEGLTQPERVTTHGRYAIHPRVSPDGTSLAYAAQLTNRISETRIIDLATGRTLHAKRRNGLGTVSWFPRGMAVALSQLQYDGPYHIFQDLYALDEGRELRLTEDARLQDPDVDRHGELLVAIENGGGSNRIVMFRNSERTTRGITDFQPDVHWALPRWSPEGDRIAVGRWTEGGEYDVVVLDTLGQVMLRLTEDRAIDGAPTWSPDGRYIIFSSDRTGIPNLYSADLQTSTPQIRQVTNVLGGALQPEVSPDGQWIYFSDYHADGYHISRIRFDPSTWRPLPPLRTVVAPVSHTGDGEPSSNNAAAPQEVSETRGYSPWRSLLPKFWAPIAYSGEVDDFIGAASAGVDLLGRHTWSAFLAADPESERWEGALEYAFAGLGNPVLELELSREWDETLGVIFQDSTRRSAIASEDAIALLATLVRRRWRSTAALSLGVEGVLVRRQILDPPVAGARHPDQRDELLGLIGRIGYANYVVPPYAISREDGFTVSLAARRRTERDPLFQLNDQAYDEVTAFAAAYKSLALPGFAHHVVAVRGGALLRDGGGLSPTSIGGAPGGFLNALGLGFAGGSQLLPVRGFERGTRRGTRAWTASAEYRLPLAMVGRRPSLSPLFIDRISMSLFADAGDAWCSDEGASMYLSCRPSFGGSTDPRSPLVGAGGELVLDAALAAIVGGRLRFGVGFPVRGPGDGPRFHVQVGSAF